MNAYEPLGYLASLLVLACFCMRGIVALRWLAIGSNFAFIGYGALAGISPVLLLHLALLPINLWRLIGAARDDDAGMRRGPGRCAGALHRARSARSRAGAGRDTALRMAGWRRRSRLNRAWASHRTRPSDSERGIE